ncbi:BTAD domain-containing putative transcriptional regulator [Streptomyces fumanus]|uniref:BTAD domain-containing putative transcriptional regulator n=1 Tax=Streptomyces fumanus TaxID=67302 RepID=UPI00167D8093|nr:BTAD domain-containing putative transcriptional regulator [Streptomyces fumanus]
MEVQRDNEVLDLGPPKRRALLLRLLLANGQTVGVDRLCDDLWDGSPPPSAMSSVHAHISRLRMVLEPERARKEQAKVLRSVPTGYALRVPPDMLDSVRFERMVQQAHALSSRGRIGEARQEAERSLGVWRGAPLLDAYQHRFAEGEAARLEALKLSVEELCTTLLLQEGQIAQAIIGAERLIERDPLREASWAMLMRALYFAGRHAEALQRYETVRALLARDLGLDPGPALRETQMAILRHDTTTLRPPPQRILLAAAPPGETVTPPNAAGPSLPGRERELTRLSGLLRDAATGHTRWAVVTGAPGTGKTRIADELVKSAAAAGFDTAYARCTGNTGPQSGVRDRTLDRLVRTMDTLTDTAEARPAFCVLEDVHRASADVREFLSSYARSVRHASLCVLLTASDAPGPDTERLLAELAVCDAEQIELAPLTESDVRQIVSTEADGAVPADMAPEMFALSGGNPFLLTQLVKQAASRRDTPDERLPVPPAIQSIVRARLAGLSPAARQVVECAAVSGDEPDMELVSQLAEMRIGVVLELADQAVAARLLSWDESRLTQASGGYRFTAGVLLRGVLMQLSPARRQILHARAARLLAARTGWDDQDIATHVVMAGPALPAEESERALRFVSASVGLPRAVAVGSDRRA